MYKRQAHDGLLHFLRRLLDGGLQRLHQGGGALLLLCVKLPVHLLALLGGGAALQLLGALGLQLALVLSLIHISRRNAAQTVSVMGTLRIPLFVFGGVTK